MTENKYTLSEIQSFIKKQNLEGKRLSLESLNMIPRASNYTIQGTLQKTIFETYGWFHNSNTPLFNHLMIQGNISNCFIKLDDDQMNKIYKDLGKKLDKE